MKFFVKAENYAVDAGFSEAEDSHLLINNSPGRDHT